MACLDVLIARKSDGHVKLLVYRKATHTDQYLSFASHHPVHQKLGVVRTLMDRCQNLVSEAEDREAQERHIREALKRCGYPGWSFKKVKQQMARPKAAKIKNRQEVLDRNKGMVVIPYVQGVSEALERVYKKHNISTAMKPHTTLRNRLVHPKDKRDIKESCGVVYQIPCKDCSKVYIGETGRQFGIRQKEHQVEATEVSEQHYTRAQRKRSETLLHKSAISDHVERLNHTIDWDNSKLLTREDHLWTRKIKESVQIRKQQPEVMNRDEGNHFLPRVYDSLLRRGTARSHENSNSKTRRWPQIDGRKY